MSKRFGLIGAAGYIARRHFEAIQAVEGDLVVAHDINDSVGVLDAYFDECEFTLNSETFYRMCTERDVDIVVVCSPNWLHMEHACRAMYAGIDVICEKPMALSKKELSEMIDARERTGTKCHAVLQLREDPEIQGLASQVRAHPDCMYQVNVEYITRRGPWYLESWKGDPRRSGGLLMNIGVHLFDALIYCFGKPSVATASETGDGRGFRGTLACPRARVTWRLSIDKDDLPVSGAAHRLFHVVGEFSDGATDRMVTSSFSDLHPKIYQKALLGEGWSIEDCVPAIQVIHGLTHSPKNVAEFDW